MATVYGRARELERIEAATARARAGTGGVLLLTGEAGIGKTTLARAAAERAAGVGLRTVWGRCWEAGGAPSYWPWVQVFRALGADPLGGPATDRSEDPAAQRFQRFDAAGRALCSAATHAPLAVFLDDLHAADPPSLLLLLFLARQVAQWPVLLVGTAREVEARLATDVADLLERVGREGERLALPRLPSEEVAAWVAAAGQGGAAIDSAEVFRLTEGNPLFVAEVLRVGTSRVGEGLAAALDAHLDRLEAADRAVLAAAAVLGRELTVSAVAALAGVARPDVAEALARASSAGVLEPHGEGRLAFTHELLRDRLYRGSGARRRAELHWRAGLAAERSGADPAVVAHHLLAGVDAGEPERAAAAALRGARAALAGLAFEAAGGLADRGLAALDGAAPGPLTCALEIAAAEAAIRSGRGDEGRARCVRVAARARQVGDGEALGEAALVHGAELVTAAVDPVLVGLLEEALAALPREDSALRVRLGTRLAAALNPPPGPEGATRIRAVAREALAAARRLDDPETLRYALFHARAGMGYLVPADERFELSRELVELARARGDRLTLLTVGPSYVVSLAERGRRPEADACAEELAALDAALAYDQVRWRVPMLRAALAMLDGALEEAARLGDLALALAERAGARPARVLWAQQRIALAVARGEPARIEAEAPRVLGFLEGNPILLPYRAWVLAALGRRAEAASALRAALGPQHWLPTLLVAAEACALLEDREAAAALVARLDERSLGARFFFGGLSPAFALGPVDRAVGGLAALAGDGALARRRLQAAVELCNGVPAVPFLQLSRAALDRVSARERPPAPGGPPAPPPRIPSLRREGELWVIEGAPGRLFRVRHSKGLEYLRELVAHPGQELHVLALARVEHRTGDAGPVLDARAKADYRRRVEALEERVAEAEAFGDAERAGRAREEITALASQLAAAVGLGGRDRRAAPDVERARVNVQRRIRAAIEQIRRCDADLARYLAGAIRTGASCSFLPW